MDNETGHRIAGLFVAVLVGVGGTLMLLGPWLFGGTAYGDLPSWATIGAAFCAAIGLWFSLVSLFTEPEDVRKVMAPLEGGDAVLLFVPYMLWHGSAALWRRVAGTRDEANYIQERSGVHRGPPPGAQAMVRLAPANVAVAGRSVRR